MRMAFCRPTLSPARWPRTGVRREKVLDSGWATVARKRGRTCIVGQRRPLSTQRAFGSTMCCTFFESSLPDDLLRAELEALTQQIADNVGVRPLCYRAGRFGMGQSSARILAELGYVADSSVTPLVSWRDESLRSAQGEGPDFRRHSAAPFVIAGSGQPGLLELPVTVILTSPWVRRHPAFTRAYVSSPARAASRLLHCGRSHPEPAWLRPFPHQSVGDLKRVWWAAQQEGLPTAVMMFHSSELMPGASPYRPTRRSVTGLLATLDEFFRFVVRAGGTPVTMSTGARRVLGEGMPRDEPYEGLPCLSIYVLADGHAVRRGREAGWPARAAPCAARQRRDVRRSRMAWSG